MLKCHSRLSLADCSASRLNVRDTETQQREAPATADRLGVEEEAPYLQ